MLHKSKMLVYVTKRIRSFAARSGTGAAAAGIGVFFKGTFCSELSLANVTRGHDGSINIHGFVVVGFNDYAWIGRRWLVEQGRVRKPLGTSLASLDTGFDVNTERCISKPVSTEVAG